MDDIKTPKRLRPSIAPLKQSDLSTEGKNQSVEAIRHGKNNASSRQEGDSISRYEYLNLLKKRRQKILTKLKFKFFKLTHISRISLLSLFSVTGILFYIAYPILQRHQDDKLYNLGAAETEILSPVNTDMAEQLSYDRSEKVFNFNESYAPRNPEATKGSGGPLIKAKIYEDPKKGLQITDPINQTDFTIKPLFRLGDGKQQQNRVVYPTFSGGHLIYTAEAAGIKEDITLLKYTKDKLSYDYKMELGDTYAARLLPGGGVGIYGSSLPLNGNISTGTEEDAALLKKARQKAEKNKLLFTIPAPVINETGGHHSEARAEFLLDGDKLTVTATGLKTARYPLAIDPTITTASATDFFLDANLETNVDVDTTNNLMRRGALTGGNISSWITTNNVTAPHFLGSSAVYAGTIFVIGGASGTTTTNLTGTNYVEQAKINQDGSVGAFSAGNATGLPAGGVSRFNLLTYNGYLYIINGSTNDTTGASISNAIYYTRITSESYSSFANGAQLVNWSNTTTNVPATARYDYGATVHNGYLYISGGRNGSGSAAGLSDVSYAPILPNGSPGAWASSTSLPAARYGHDMQAYYGHLYIVGGNLNGTLTPTVLYSSIAANGAVADTSWKSTNSLVNSGGTDSQPLENLGSGFSMVANGFMYVTGGCASVNASQSCTAAVSYSQLSQINADGSLGSWFPNGGGSALQRLGTPVTGYDGSFYSVGGCSAMNSGSVSCSTTSLTSSYANINNVVGDISAKRNPTSLPVALYGHATVVLNGYVYVLGGCLTNSCDGVRTANYTTYYALIGSDGSLGSWANNTSSTTANSPLRWDGQATPLFGSADCAAGGSDQCGLAGITATVYGGYIYVLGGFDGAAWSNAVYYMQPDASTGQQGLWTKSGNTIANASGEGGFFAYNGSLYSIGGCSGTAGIGCSTYYTQVQKSVIGSSGAPGAWSGTGGSPSQVQLSAGIAAFGTAVYGGFIYLAGGANATNGQESFVQRARIDSSGNIVTVGAGGWVKTTGNMTQSRRRTVATAVNGYLYVIGGHSAADLTEGPNGTTYGDIQIGKIDLSPGSSGNITTFIQSAQGAVTKRWNPAVAFGNGFMYVTGGCTVGHPPANCTTTGTTNESFVVYNANNLGANTWNNQTNTYSAASPNPAQTNRLGMGAVAYNGYLYVAGGCTNFTVSTLTCNTTSNSTAYAPIIADGTLGQWSAGPNLPAATAFGQLVGQSGYLYYIGGQTGGISNAVASVYKSTIGASGVPGAFSATGQAVLPENRTQIAAVTYAGFIYVAGGFNNTASANRNSVYYSSINAVGDITSWSTTSNGFTNARRELTMVTAGAYLYIIGGYDGTNYFADVQVATPNTTSGNISSWSYAQEIPSKQASMSAVAANGYIYVFGGRNGSSSASCTNQTYFTSVNGNGTVGDWQQNPSVFSTARFGAGGAYQNGYFYVMGGNDCSNILSSNVIQQSGQLSQAMHATYSRYIDFQTDAMPLQFYVTGANAAIGGNDVDRWKVIYKTSRGATNSWGNLTSFTLNSFGYGNAYSFTPIDGSGVNQGVAQYWQISFDIDQSQSFGFPDENQPTITKYDFYFSPGPGKRLRNGKTFINNQQTTLDAHP